MNGEQQYDPFGMHLELEIYQSKKRLESYVRTHLLFCKRTAEQADDGIGNSRLLLLIQLAVGVENGERRDPSRSSISSSESRTRTGRGRTPGGASD